MNHIARAYNFLTHQPEWRKVLAWDGIAPMVVGECPFERPMGGHSRWRKQDTTAFRVYIADHAELSHDDAQDVIELFAQLEVNEIK
jgi:hypothetical protein